MYLFPESKERFSNRVENYIKYRPGYPAEIIDFLKREKVILRGKFIEWLNEKYRLVSISDKSVWTLRLGESVERYVHIHPGRYSHHTRRVKALTLKTAILTLCCERLGEPKLSGKELINEVRKKYLNEPPLKSVSSEAGLGKLLELLR